MNQIVAAVKFRKYFRGFLETFVYICFPFLKLIKNQTKVSCRIDRMFEESWVF